MEFKRLIDRREEIERMLRFHYQFIVPYRSILELGKVDERTTYLYDRGGEGNSARGCYESLIIVSYFIL